MENEPKRCGSCNQLLWGFHNSNEAGRVAFALWDYLSSIGQHEKAVLAERLMTFVSPNAPLIACTCAFCSSQFERTTPERFCSEDCRVNAEAETSTRIDL